MSFYDNDREQNIYETGRTRPPKSRGGLIALVLIALIFVGGIYSAMLSLNLSPPSENREGENCLNFSQPKNEEFALNEAEEQAPFSCNAVGLSGEFLSALDQTLGHLPGGLYVTQVDAGSDAEKKGIRPGDILLQLDDIQITDQSSVNTALCNRPGGETVRITFLRGGSKQSLELTLSEEEDQ